MSLVMIQNLTKTYKNGKRAVDDLTLSIEQGTIHGFIGHNGAGKTTTLKCMTGILDFEAGEITINGHSIKHNPIACKQQVAYIPDNPDLYESLTGILYLNFIADVCGIDKNARETRIKRHAEAFELLPNLGDLISSYSHGMKQKLALISAFIREPALLVLDEPFVGLDPRAAHTMKEQLRAFCNTGSAVFFSTHVLDVAEKLCDNVSIIRGGKLIANGPTAVVKGDSSLESLFLELTDTNGDTQASEVQPV